MAIEPLTAALEFGKSALEKLFPDPAQRAAAALNLERLHQEGDLAGLNAEVSLLLGQIDINKIEAASDSFFKSGWRPAVGWTCVLGLFYSFFLRPILVWVILLYHGDAAGEAVVPPSLNIGDLLTLLFGLLGLGGLRTFEKFKGVTKS